MDKKKLYGLLTTSGFVVTSFLIYSYFRHRHGGGSTSLFTYVQPPLAMIELF